MNEMENKVTKMELLQALLRREFSNETEMKVTFSSIEVNRTSETAGHPPATYRSHVSIKISRGCRLSNNQLTKEQSGFRLLHSTLTFLLKSTDD